MIIDNSHLCSLLPAVTKEVRHEKDADEAKEVAREFAALIYRQLLEKAKPSSCSGSASGLWWEVFSGEIAREITRSSPLTEFFYLQLNKEMRK